MLWLSSMVFISVTLAAGAVFVYLSEKALQRERVARFVTGYGVEKEEEPERSFYERVIAPLWNRSRKKQQRKLRSADVRKLELLLLQAGSPYGMGPAEFRLMQKLVTVMLALFTAALGIVLQLEMAAILLMTAAVMLLSLVVPKLMLKNRAKARSKEALQLLPDTMDLFTISLEAGLGFDSAIAKVTEKKAGVLSNEFKTYLEEVRLGKTRKEALSAINDRLHVEELRTLIYNINQAEKLGIGMVSVLRVQTEDIRLRRKQRIEEKAMKAPVKMLFPLVFFIFPTLFIILLAPAALQMMEAFSK
ncbi:type II secretion system F family protein [Bacillus daqingensis]|uniref:Type II secretion system F family protein n=1 Tax=Bacillus daqingensis TaxID=872396 RepID=A0ABV9NVD1_9BACI